MVVLAVDARCWWWRGGDPSSGGAGDSRRVAVDWWWWPCGGHNCRCLRCERSWSTLRVVVVLLVDAGGGVFDHSGGGVVDCRAQVKYIDKMVPRWC